MKVKDLGQYSLLIEKCEQEIRNNIAAKEKVLEEKYSLDIYKQQICYRRKAKLDAESKNFKTALNLS